jgi:hypothetical protein
MNKGKLGASAYIHAECSNAALGSSCPHHLNELLDILFNPSKSIDDWETIDWCKWLMAGGRTPAEFTHTGLPLLLACFFTLFLPILPLILSLSLSLDSLHLFPSSLLSPPALFLSPFFLFAQGHFYHQQSQRPLLLDYLSVTKVLQTLEPVQHLPIIGITAFAAIFSFIFISIEI